MPIRYATNADQSGWLSVVPDGVDPAAAAANPSRRIALPQWLKVNVYKTDKGREYFEILEGPNKGKKASVKIETGGRSYLSATPPPPSAPVSIKFSPWQQKLWFGGRGPFSAFTESTDPVPTGTWDLEIPDAPHDSPSQYNKFSVFYRTWFRILASSTSDRYLHLGVISHGCVTARPWITSPMDPRINGRSAEELGLPIPNDFGPVVPPTPWTDVYNYLIAARQNDQTVGSIVVMDT